MLDDVLLCENPRIDEPGREACTGGSEGLEAYGHSRSMATGTGPDVRKCRGRQACRAGNTCNQAQQSKHTADKLKGDTRGGRGGWGDPGDEASGVSAQDMSGQGGTGGGRRVDQPCWVA